MKVLCVSFQLQQLFDMITIRKLCVCVSWYPFLEREIFVIHTQGKPLSVIAHRDPSMPVWIHAVVPTLLMSCVLPVTAKRQIGSR
eukprot:3313375-Amphidinium_carterae.1